MARIGRTGAAVESARGRPGRGCVSNTGRRPGGGGGKDRLEGTNGSGGREEKMEIRIKAGGKKKSKSVSRENLGKAWDLLSCSYF